MTERPVIEYVHEGQFVAAVNVVSIETDSEWSPYYSIADVRKLEAVREALRHGDVAAAAQHGQVYEMTPVAAE
jgi:hypothetical protein